MSGLVHELVLLWFINWLFFLLRPMSDASMSDREERIEDVIIDESSFITLKFQEDY